VSYDPNGLREFFNSYAEKEWERLEDSLQGRIKYSVHRHILDKYLKSGIEVLDVGCGPGRFALHVAKTGASITLIDISERQLELAQAKLSEAGVAHRVHGLHRLDVLSLSSISDGTYDLVLCYGSVLSYTYERHTDALRELARVAKAGRTVLVSVTALYGTMRLIGSLDAVAFAERPHDHLDWRGLLGGCDVVLTSVGSPEFHQPMALFNSRGLAVALKDAGLETLEMATSNPLIPVGTAMERVSQNGVSSKNLEELEIALCQCPGLIEAGEHLIAAARKL
jgi:SAM-dependent methyltransferase